MGKLLGIVTRVISTDLIQKGGLKKVVLEQAQLLLSNVLALH